MKIFTPLLLLLVLHASASAGPLVIGSDLPGWKISDPDFYSAKELYGYINGGAELYLEYGFRQVSAQRCSRGDHELQVDIYQMVSPEAAFGIWSILRGDCPEQFGGADWSCLRPEQILFARGPYLVSVVPYDRAKTTRDAAEKAAAALLKRIGGRDFRPSELFRSGPLSPGRNALQFLHGPLALQNALPSWDDLLDGIQRFDLYHSAFGTGSRKTEAAIIETKTKRDMDRILGRLGAADAGREWSKASKHGGLVKRKNAKTAWYLKGGQAEDLSRRMK